tara:strand:+ start:1051 stop:1239 length:189 start_codon:yes stop_codon:yes gene_type:complete
LGLQPTKDQAKLFAIGLQPVEESFLIQGWTVILIGLPVGLLFYLITLLLTNKFSLYSFVLRL